MAIDQKVDYSPVDQRFIITTKYDRLEMSLCHDPVKFTKEVEYQISCRVAEVIVEAIKKAFEKE